MESCQNQRDIHQRSTKEQSGWFSIIKESTPRSGKRWFQSRPKSVAHGNIGYVSRPHLIGVVNFKISEQIGINLMFRAGPAGPGLGIDGVKPHEPHEAPHPFFIHPMTLISKPAPHLLNSKGGSPGVLLVNQTHQKIVILIILSGPVII